MNVTYFKRFRMEMDLRDAAPVPELPESYFWIPWDDSRIELHAEIKFQSFHEELDAVVFPSLSERAGCCRLMREIACKPGFVPEATWLLARGGETCGTVQGISDRAGVGSIQNLGVLPGHRGRGLGSALLLKALEGFRRVGLSCAFLEATARNESAVRLYRRLGFRCRKTTYRAVPVAAVPRWYGGIFPQHSLASRQ